MSRKKITPPPLEAFEPKDSLREKVYDYLNESMANGRLRCGEYLDQNKICRELKVSKAPLRDALIKLEAEGFIAIFPYRGVMIKPLTLDTIREVYQVIGALEADCIHAIFEQFDEEHIRRFQESNEQQRALLEAGEHKAYYDENICFHNIFISLAKNPLLESILTPLRRRLYDFPRRFYSKEWEMLHLTEHQRFIDSVIKGNKRAAASIFRDEHWSFHVHKPYLMNFYQFEAQL